MRRKLNFSLEQMGQLLNAHMAKLLRVTQLYYINKPVDVDSRFDVSPNSLLDPVAIDPFNEPAYSFYN